MQTHWMKVKDVIKLLFIFALMTVIFYFSIVWVTAQIESYQRGEEPQGKYETVFQPEQSGRIDDWQDVTERMLFYYRFGE